MTRVPVGRLAAGSVLAFVLLPLQAQAPGVLWQVTTKMLMPGMNMPGQTSEVCAAKTWTKPPGGERQGCTSSGFAMNGNTASWDTVCTGQQSMKGHGEITLSGDSYKGSIKFSGDGFAMMIELEGKKVGDCPNPQ
jgi:hypothetical protein